MGGSQERPVVRFYRDSSLDTPHQPPTRRYLIVTSPRAGSTWLAQTLGATGACGVPGEYLHPGVINAFRQWATAGFSFGHFMAELEPRRTTPNGVFALKLLAGQTLARMRAANREPLIQVLLAHFDRLIYLQRRDKIAQAMSFYVAEQTGRFTMATAADRDQLRAAKTNLDFAPQALTRALHSVTADDAEARAIRDRATMPVLTVAYEDLLAEPAGAFARVFDFLEIDADPTAIPAPTYKMRDTDLEARTEAFRKWLNGDD